MKTILILTALFTVSACATTEASGTNTGGSATGGSATGGGTAGSATGGSATGGGTTAGGAAGSTGGGNTGGAGAGCPALEPDDDSPLPVQSINNLTKATQVNGYQDAYLYNQAGDRKIGLRRDWGGSIVFFGLDTGQEGMNTTNTVDGADTGREVQVALYDRPGRTYQGCAFNASCGQAPTPCPETMAFMGWNPVQGGNRCNIGSDTSDVSLAKGQISLTTSMLQWNPNWDRADCKESCNDPASDKRLSDVELTQRVRFVRPDVVELLYSIHNLGDVDHEATVHEFPTLYAAFGRQGTPDLYRLFDSGGNELANGWQTDIHGFRWQYFSSPGGWASLQNANADYGVALYYESGMGEFQAWDKLENPTKFNNFRGLYSFPIKPFAWVNARSYLILGSISHVASEAQWLDTHLPPFGHLDEPVADAHVSGVIPVFGWSLDNKSVSKVQMILDGGAPVDLTYGTDRPDVCGVWPGYPACDQSKVGFQGELDASSLAPNDCGHVLEIKTIDGDGNEKIIARRRIYGQ